MCALSVPSEGPGGLFNKCEEETVAPRHRCECVHAHTHSHPGGGEREGTAAKSLRSDPQPSVYGKDLLLMHPYPLQRFYWELSMHAKLSLSAHHCWEQDMAARAVCLLAATSLVRFLLQACSSGLEQLEANAAERTAWMLRVGTSTKGLWSVMCI